MALRRYGKLSPAHPPSKHSWPPNTPLLLTVLRPIFLYHLSELGLLFCLFIPSQITLLRLSQIPASFCTLGIRLLSAGNFAFVSIHGPLKSALNEGHLVKQLSLSNMQSVPKPASSKSSFIRHHMNYLLTTLPLNHSPTAFALPTPFLTLSSTFVPNSADKTSGHSLGSF